MIVRNRDDGVRVLAPAKLNLFLEVTGRREDGYHDLETLMTPVDLFDEIDVALSDSGVALTSDADWLPTDRENLAYRAGERILARAGRGPGLRIALRKRIPAGAGLGGGSSDAAAVLVGGAILLGLDASPGALQADAAVLGSDVPFFLHGASAICRGRGELVEPCRVDGVSHYVLVVPDVRVSTKAVYESLILKLTSANERRKIIPGKFLGEDCRESERALFNRLEEVAFRLHPELAAFKGEIERVTSRVVSMTGSGSGLFSTAPSRKEAEKLRSSLERRLGWGKAFALTTARAHRDA